MAQTAPREGAVRRVTRALSAMRTASCPGAKEVVNRRQLQLVGARRARGDDRVETVQRHIVPRTFQHRHVALADERAARRPVGQVARVLVARRRIHPDQREADRVRIIAAALHVHARRPAAQHIGDSRSVVQRGIVRAAPRDLCRHRLETDHLHEERAAVLSKL